MCEHNSGKTCSFDVCSNCKLSCCVDANPPLTTQREKTIENYLKNEKISFKRPFVREEYSHPASDADGVCVFFSKKTGECIVHAVKPETCKAGPVTFDINLTTRKIEWFLKKVSICRFAPKLREKQVQFSEHFEVAKEEITRLICNLETEELLAILKISEPETIKIGENELPRAIIHKLRIT